MKRIAVFALAGFLAGSVLLAQSRGAETQFSTPFLDEVVRLSNAGTSDATIIAFIHARQARLEWTPTADDLVRLKQAGVSEKVIEYLASIPVAGGHYRERSASASVEAAADDGSDVVAYDTGGGYYYRPDYYPYYWGWGFYGGPYFYPSFVIRRSFRFGHFGHHHFRGRRFR